MMRSKSKLPLQLACVFLGIIILNACLKDRSEQQQSHHQNVHTEDRQYLYADLTKPISQCEASDLTYFMNDCFTGTGYEAGIQAAMDAYNDAPLSLHWTKVDNKFEADLIFNCVEGGECGGGIASPPIDLETLHPSVFGPDGVCLTFGPNVQSHFPSGGSIGGLINMNEPFTSCTCSSTEMDLCFFKAAIMHEVAHSLGMFHNDFFNDIAVLPIDCQMAIYEIGLSTHVDGTPIDVDPGSIINSGPHEFSSGNWCNPICELGTNDLTALKILYPEVTIEGPEYLCLNEKGQYCLEGLNIGTETEVHWSLTDNMPIPTGGIQNISAYACEYFEFDSPGEYTITAWIIEGKCSYSISKTITVLEQEENCLECFCVCFLEDQWGNTDWHEVQIDCDSDCDEIEEQGNIGNYLIEYCEKEIRPNDETIEELPCDDISRPTLVGSNACTNIDPPQYCLGFKYDFLTGNQCNCCEDEVSYIDLSFPANFTGTPEFTINNLWSQIWGEYIIDHAIKINDTIWRVTLTNSSSPVPEFTLCNNHDIYGTVLCNTGPGSDGFELHVSFCDETFIFYALVNDC